MVNDAVAYIRSLAELRDRNADWAERAVRDGESLSASAALRENVVDIVVGDVAELFGAGDDGAPTADDWAEAAGTINYEIVTRFGSARVPRVYSGRLQDEDVV